MEDIILKLCKDVLANGSNDQKVSCYKLECEQCIFCSDNRSDMFGCHENDEADIKIAKQYIKEHTPISEIERTFREVIADIKVGEVWENIDKSHWNLKEINCFDNDGRKGIRIVFKKETDYYTFTDNENLKFKLKRKQYTFDEAFKAYEEGKEIESCYSQYKYKKEGGLDLYSKTENEWYGEDNFEIDEIRGKWYINN